MIWSFVRVAGAAAAGYAAVVALVYAMQRDFMYRPSGRLPSPDAAGLPEMSVITLETSDGLVLTSWYRPPQSAPAPVILYFPGNAGSIAHRGAKVRPLLDEGHGLLLLSYRGYGGNPGTPTERGLIADGRAALEFLATQGIPRSRTVLFGESLGTGVAVRLAAEGKVGAVILESPFTSAAAVAQKAYFFLPAALLIKDRFDNRSSIGRIGAPLLVIHGGRDRLVPVTEGRSLFAAARAPKTLRVIDEAGHNDLHFHGATDHEIAFLRTLYPKTGE